MRRVSFVLSALLVVPALAWGSVALQLTIEQLTQRAGVVIHARVSGQHAAWTRGGRIVTTSELEVIEPLKGRPGASVQVRSQGGIVGGVGQQVAGEAHFTANEEVVVFLRPTGLSDASFAVLGMSQGKFRVTPGAQGPIASQNLDGLAVLAGEDHHVEEAQPASVSVADLKARIARAQAP